MAPEYIQSSPPSYPNVPAGYSGFVRGQPASAQVSHAYHATSYSHPAVVPTTSQGYFDFQQGYAFSTYQDPYSNLQATHQNHRSQSSYTSIPLDATSYNQPVSGQLQGTFVNQDTHSFAHCATPPAGLAFSSHSHAYDQRMLLPPVPDGGISRITAMQRPPPRTPVATHFLPPLVGLGGGGSSEMPGERDWAVYDAVPSTPDIATYPCMWSSHGHQCGHHIEGEKNRIAQHLRDFHNFVCDEKQMTCLWDQCDTLLQRRNVARHIVTYHLGVKVLCKHCGIPLSRQDAKRKHQKSCASAPKAGAAVHPSN